MISDRPASDNTGEGFEIVLLFKCICYELKASPVYQSNLLIVKFLLV